jgi:hypothetical protein
LIFNGHTQSQIDEIDVVTMLQIQTMYADGLLGNQGIITALGNLTNGVFNYIRQTGAPPYALKDIIGQAYDYIYPPAPEEDKKEKANNSLLLFLSQVPGFNVNKFEVTNG